MARITFVAEITDLLDQAQDMGHEWNEMCDRFAKADVYPGMDERKTRSFYIDELKDIDDDDVRDIFMEFMNKHEVKEMLVIP